MSPTKLSHRFGGVGALIVVATLTGCPPAPDPNVSTHHNDNFRTGAYLNEKLLTPAAVKERGMHIKYWLNRCDTFIAAAPPGKPAGCFDGTIETQPLFVHQHHFKVNTPVGTVEANAGGLFFATTHNKVYGLIASTGQRMWETDLMLGTNHQPLNPGFEPRGVNSTPVIDVANNHMFVLFSSKLSSHQPWKDCSGLKDDPRRLCDLGNYRIDNSRVAYWLAMIDLSSGAIAHEIPISVFATNGNGDKVPLEGKNQMDHPALLLDQGFVYVSLGSIAMFEGLESYDFHGWVVRFTASDLADPTVFCTSPNESPAAVKAEGGSGIWQGGGGLAADSTGNIYFLTGNGHSNLTASPKNQSFGDSFVKLTFSGGNVTATAFAPTEAAALAAKDADLGSGGALIIPDSNVVIGGGKTGYMYVLDRVSMKRTQDFAATTNNYHPEQRGQGWDVGPHLHGSPSFWRGPDANYGYLYVWGEKDVLKQYEFAYASGRFSKWIDPTTGFPEVKPLRQAKVRALESTMPGGMISISANGNNKGSSIIWATLPDSDCPPLFPTCPTPRPVPPYSGHLYSFDAETLEPLWDTNFGIIAHWVPPTIAEGLVFIAEGAQIMPYFNGMLLAYELGNRDGSEKKTTPPFQPFPHGQETCLNGCHATRNTLHLVTADHPMSEMFANGASVPGKATLAHSLTEVPRGHALVAMFEGDGEALYAAAPNADRRGEFEWQFKGTTAQLESIDAPNAEQRAKAKVQLAIDQSWSASDGSQLTSEIEAIAGAPEGTDLPWSLNKVAKSNGDGLLREVEYIRRVYTHAGRPPSTPPKRAGEQVRVPYHAMYWLYR